MKTIVCGLDVREWDILSGFLHMLGEFGGRRGCDDFHFAEHVNLVENRRKVMEQFHVWNGDPEEYDPAGTYEWEHAWALAGFYSQKRTYHPQALERWETELIAALLRYGSEDFAWRATALSSEIAGYMDRLADIICPVEP
jgi:hypothetical protein